MSEEGNIINVYRENIREERIQGGYQMACKMGPVFISSFHTLLHTFSPAESESGEKWLREGN